MGETTGSPKDQFRRLKSLRALFTTGCNIPIFVAGHGKVVAIDPPCKDFEWRNYYDEDDVLGWPLRPLSDSYDKLVKDYEINVGGLFTSWNPLGHTEYWKDEDFLRQLVDFLLKLLTASNLPPTTPT